jgi:hypothetical protein
MSAEVSPQFFAPAVLADPFELYDRLRTDQPVTLVTQPGQERTMYLRPYNSAFVDDSPRGRLVKSPPTGSWF